MTKNVNQVKYRQIRSDAWPDHHQVIRCQLKPKMRLISQPKFGHLVKFWPKISPDATLKHSRIAFWVISVWHLVRFQMHQKWPKSGCGLAIRFPPWRWHHGSYGITEKNFDNRPGFKKNCDNEDYNQEEGPSWETRYISAKAALLRALVAVAVCKNSREIMSAIKIPEPYVDIKYLFGSFKRHF